MRICVNGIEIEYEVCGSGRPLIMLHGNGEDHHIFDALSAKLKQHFTIYALDTRNHGKSESSAEFSYEMCKEDVLEFMQVLELEGACVVGFSDGAIVSLLLELEYPHRFAKMALLGINLKPTDFTKASLNFLEKEYAESHDPLLKMMLEQPNIELDHLREIECPTLVVGAQYDVFYRKTFTNVARMIPQSTLKIVKGHDHGSYIVGNDMMAEELLLFFGR